MGRLSDRTRSARRLGKRERARVKKVSRRAVWGTVGGAGTYHVKAGRKKFAKALRYVEAALEQMRPSIGDSVILKSPGEIKRPLYTISPIIPYSIAECGPSVRRRSRLPEVGVAAGGLVEMGLDKEHDEGVSCNC